MSTSSDVDSSAETPGPKVAGRRIFDGDRMLADLGEGFATIRMTLGARAVQAHGTADGGALSTLADGAVGVA